jgi:murein L,D-transpeptidase YcbB/YkuD
VLLSTSQLQRIAKGLEDAAAGRYKRQVDASLAAGQQQQGADAGAASSAAQLQAALVKAADRQTQLVAVLQQLRQQAPELQEQFDGVLVHAAAAETWLGNEGRAAVTAQ